MIGKSYGASKFWDSLFLDYLYRLFLVPTSRPLSAPKKESTSCPWPLGQIPGSLGLRQTPCAPKKVQPTLAAVERWVPSKWEGSANVGTSLSIKTWLVGGLEHEFDVSIQLGMSYSMSSSQLTIHHILQRGRLKPPNSYYYSPSLTIINHGKSHWMWMLNPWKVGHMSTLEHLRVLL